MARQRAGEDRLRDTGDRHAQIERDLYGPAARALLLRPIGDDADERLSGRRVRYGGLQFSQSTWDAYGGREFAPRADMDGRDQQTAIAEKVLKGQGPWGEAHLLGQGGPRSRR
jgi:hypothetical protein